MVRTTGRIEACVRPIAEVAVLPYGYEVGGASVGFEIVGACEGFEEELVALGEGGVDASAVGGNDVVALFVVVVAEELGLRRRG